MVMAGLIGIIYIRGVEGISMLGYGMLWGVVITRRRIGRISKTKVVVAGSTRVHIRVMIRGIYIGEYGIVILHIGIHGMVKVYGFILCRVMSHSQQGRLDSKRRRRRGRRGKVRVGGRVMGILGLIR